MSHRYLRIPGMGKFVVFSFGFLTRLSIDCGFCSPTLFVSTWRNYDELIAISHRGFSPRSRRFLFGEYPHSARFGRPLRRLIILRSAIWRWRGRMGGAVGGVFGRSVFTDRRCIWLDFLARIRSALCAMRPLFLAIPLVNSVFPGRLFRASPPSV